MKATPKPIRFERLPEDYVGLCKLLMPRPIHDKVDLHNVTEMAQTLAGRALTEDQTDYFDLLSSLVRFSSESTCSHRRSRGWMLCVI